MNGFNKVILAGNVGKDPEIKTLQSGVKLASFSLATSKKWKDDGGEQHEKTEWHNCTAWRKLADIVEKYVKKGDALLIEGEIVYETSEKDGKKSYFTKINVGELRMLGGKQDGSEINKSMAATFDNPVGEAKTKPINDPSDFPF